MAELNEVRKVAVELMHQHNLHSWSFEFDNASRRFGRCNYTLKKITLSKKLSSVNDINRVKNTILHEIAHAIVGHEHGHDDVWRDKAISIGCNGERCFSSRNTILVESKWIGRCMNGHEHRRYKTPTRESSCGLCSPKFNKEFIIKWELNR